MKGLTSRFHPWVGTNHTTADPFGLGGLQFLDFKNCVVLMEGHLPHFLCFFLTVKYLIYGIMGPLK